MVAGKPDHSTPSNMVELGDGRLNVNLSYRFDTAPKHYASSSSPPFAASCFRDTNRRKVSSDRRVALHRYARSLAMINHIFD
ncbi:hypothetical protein EVAR_17511_1 [Eumeta japonica]|uniref:Uncharacterized protein n=1 Tax=Eumeta variegata TaxID=151549 RepID=A0A4C1WPL2_EUMVA|nr:hypothetical protein EVAR_17511_1 [Eumeta japonica]